MILWQQHITTLSVSCCPCEVVLTPVNWHLIGEDLKWAEVRNNELWSIFCLCRALVRRHCPAIGRWACSTLDHLRQLDSTSCGVFVCKVAIWLSLAIHHQHKSIFWYKAVTFQLAEQILQGDIISYAVDQQGVNSIRLEMATALLTNTGMYFSTRYTETFVSVLTLYKYL